MGIFGCALLTPSLRSSALLSAALLQWVFTFSQYLSGCHTSCLAAETLTMGLAVK
jgi:hypothetical protein